METSLVMMYAFSLFIIYVLAYLLYIPLQYMMRLLTAILLGGTFIWVANILGGRFGLSIAINPITAFVAGTLGIPGITLLAALKSLVAKTI